LGFQFFGTLPEIVGPNPLAQSDPDYSMTIRQLVEGTTRLYLGNILPWRFAHFCMAIGYWPIDKCAVTPITKPSNNDAKAESELETKY
jgi:hypothetical protein